MSHYTASVTACEVATVNEASLYRATVRVTRVADGTEVKVFGVDVNAQAYPTLAELQAELERVAALEVDKLEDVDANAAAVVGTVLV